MIVDEKALRGLLRFEVLGQEFMDAVNGMSGQFFQEGFEPRKGIAAMQFAGAQQGVQHSRTPGGFMAAGK